MVIRKAKILAPGDETSTWNVTSFKISRARSVSAELGLWDDRCFERRDEINHKRKFNAESRGLA